MDSTYFHITIDIEPPEDGSGDDQIVDHIEQWLDALGYTARDLTVYEYVG